MRPLRLTMQAFGPFAGREVVDFREATAAGLFGVYGSTGAGKSTIFSAMTFALFGEAAKEEQEATSLRSDYATRETITEVELVFEIANRRYVVRRRPEQMRLKRRGAGETKVPHEGWLTDATGIPLDKITAVDAGKVVAEKKASTVSAAIEELLGYGPRQFRQIVLLPQGRFEKFLAAKTDARLVILRELFDVSLYRGLAEKMKADAVAIERQVRDQREFYVRRLQAEQFESGDALRAGVEAARAMSVDQAEQEGRAIAAAKSAADALSAAELVEQRFLADETAQEALAALVGQESEIREVERGNQRVRRVEAMQESERTLSEAEQEVVGVSIEVGDATRAAADAKQAMEGAAAELVAQKARELERAGLRAELQQLKLHQQALADAERLADDARTAAGGVEKVTKAFTSAEALRKRKEQAVTAAEQALEGLRKNEILRARLNVELTGLQAEEVATKSFEQKARELGEATAGLARALAESGAAEKAAQSAQQLFRVAERQLSEVQALYLATKLVEGEPCLVCGATDHPRPAFGTIESAGLDEAFRKAKSDLEKAEKARELADKELARAAAKKTVLEGYLAELDRPQRSQSDVRGSINVTRRQIAELGEAEDVLLAEQRIVPAQEARDKARISAEALQGTKAAVETAAAQATAKLEQALSTIPEVLRQQSALERAMKVGEQKLQAAEAALQQAETLERKTREAALSADKDLEGAAARLAAAQDRRDLAARRFADRLAESGLTKNEFSALKPAVATIRESERRVEEYNRQLDVYRARAGATAAAIENVIRPDLVTLRQMRDEANRVVQAATEGRARNVARLEQLEKLYDELTKILEELAKLEEDSNALRTLALLFNAENEQRLDLETFAIGAMFDQVIEAANQRLVPMTNGRFTLEREVEATGGRSRRGLGIQVHDLHTGKTRATATLSGGETFIAALSLALGLSDVVERANARVRLDTIFIDEGFGSLDAENEAGTLDQVLRKRPV